MSKILGICSCAFIMLVMSCSEHNADDRSLTNSLVDHSEIAKYTDYKSVLKTLPADWCEAVVGWKSVDSSPKVSSNVTALPKRKKAIERSVTDLHFNNQAPVDDYWSSCSTDCKATVRCVGDDLETLPVPAWKSNIEQGTYRYIPDSGTYRTMKFMYDDRKEWFTIRKRYPEKVATTWQHSCKRMQRELRRQLKKDMKLQGKSQANGDETVAKPDSGELTSRSEVGNLTSRSEMSTKDARESSRSPDKLDKQSVLTVEKYAKPEKFDHQRTLYRKDNRVRSTQSDGAVTTEKKMTTIHESEPVTPVPQYSIPCGNQMIKSASDLFIENFSTRLHALEEEMKKDSKWIRKTDNGSPLPKVQHRGKFRDPVTRVPFKESISTTMPRMPPKTETLTTDIFSVKSVHGQNELRPLEKTKSFKSNNSGGDCIKKTTEAPRQNNHNDGSELDKAISGYKVAIDTTKKNFFNALTGTKIDTQGSKKAPKGFSSPATITICDNNVKGNSTNIEPGDSLRQVPLEKKTEHKAQLQIIPSVLPEISGKRLEMSSISQRLL